MAPLLPPSWAGWMGSDSSHCSLVPGGVVVGAALGFFPGGSRNLVLVVLMKFVFFKQICDEGSSLSFCP